MVIGYGDSSVLQETINVLDDKNIDFFIHWDKKSLLPQLKAKYSKIIFIKRIKLYWGTDTQVLTEQNLLKAVYKSKQSYDYVHLISSADMPLMTKEYFKSYFSKDVYIAFMDNIPVQVKQRIDWYYPFRNVNVRNSFGVRCILNPCRKINSFFRIKRIKNDSIIEKGTNWYSMKASLIKEVLEFPDFKMFLHSYLADELYMQTILRRFKPKNPAVTSDSELALRYIDWDRGHPYTFKLKDTNELQLLVNTKYAFARKVTDVQILKAIFHKPSLR
ncbi:beta-1,6-N-acetylglucosaminyltransferase [Pediococcus inopinatus]|uniref:beta-1,6-N-acetylglucosaminyltransferase n=1 Tax=Pediococcus inopinatus TaxID=114090 RepID=UPI0007C4BE7D|nr:beta-1,6-N-acetylglucosaminyltransferase [Pediococcus inopinatus]